MRAATRDLAADCPNRKGPVYVACDVFYPQLRTWFMRRCDEAAALREALTEARRPAWRRWMGSP